ncbi:2-oxo acid dehydrogenase subunit E2 [Granulosicoccus sp. 3-233]|uniref:2-oxo acid dehydrogenase subunit E2 n=1 Tax=Granulosicoccus sp. 3-233 TaxID=3417969 RepID=UPI003D355624
MSESDNVKDIVIPDIGDSENVEIIEILVSPGDQISVDDSLLTLESDKASMEVPATEAGVIESLSISVGDTVNAGDVIGTMSTMDGGSADEKASSSKDSSKDSSSEGSTDSSRESSEDDAAPTAADDAPRESDSSASAAEESKAAASKAADKSSSTSSSPTAHISDDRIRKAHASPGVRRYAREHGADLSLISGTGPKGRISKDDVRAFIKQAMEGVSANYGSHAGGVAGSGAGIPAIPEVDFTKFGDVERVPLGRINKLSAANLHRAWLNLPMVTHHELADVTEMESFRKQLKNEAREGDPKVTGLAFHMKALVKTLQAFPRLNSSLSADGEALFYKNYYHIGIAVDTPNGLVVPVFRDVDKKSINQLAEEMSDVSSRARNKKLKPDEMQGASMTISSLGGIGGTSFTPIVNPPEVAILGITRATMQPVWNGSEFVPRLMCPLDLTYDHRVVDGADAARFMAHYVRQISDIRRLTL